MSGLVALSRGVARKVLVVRGMHSNVNRGSLDFMAKSTKTKRSGSSGQFVLGSRSFGSISAVEGISPSKRLQLELQRLKGASSDKRRTVLAETYGSKK